MNAADACVPLARSLFDFFAKREEEGQEYSIFLCGGARGHSSSIRESVRRAIEGRKSRFAYKVYYPEDMFSELLLGHARDSLLNLENMLARSVSSVALIAESAGALVELGAFSNHTDLSKKLIVILDARYRLSRSFINLGPVRHLNRMHPGRVSYFSLEANSVHRITDVICDATRQIAEKFPAEQDLSNPIASYRFFLALVHVFDPLPKEWAFQISERLANEEKDVTSVTATVIASLIEDGYVTISSKGLSTTPVSRGHLVDRAQSQKGSAEIAAFLDRCRVDALNLVLRNPKFRRRVA